MKTLFFREKECYILIILIYIIIILKPIFYKKIILVLIILFCFLIFFYRIPKINFNKSKKILVSPCTGKIIKIEKLKNKYKIYIFLSVFNPHIQIIPYSGLVVKSKYIEGINQIAYKLEKDNYRSRYITQIQTKHGKIEIIQNTGIIARRIKNSINFSKNVKKGDYLGIIKFGSRVDIEIPNKFKLLKKLNDKIEIGEELSILN